MESQTTEYKLQWADKYLAYVSGFANLKEARSILALTTQVKL